MTFKELRKKNNLSLRQAAERLGVNFQAICRYENKGRVPKSEILKKMMEVYNCTEAELGDAIVSNVVRGLNMKDKVNKITKDINNKELENVLKEVRSELRNIQKESLTVS